VGASAPVVDLASAQGTAQLLLCTTDDDCNIGEVCVPDNGGTKCIDDGGASGANEVHLVSQDRIVTHEVHR